MIHALKCAGRRLLRQVNGAIVVLFMVVAVLAVADEIEGGTLPILKHQATEAAPVTEPGLVCWHWSFVKARDAVPLSFSWTMERDGKRYSVIPLPAGGQAPMHFREMARGTVVNRKFCAPSPSIEGSGPTVITGHAYYRTHGFWAVRQDFAPAVIP